MDLITKRLFHSVSNLCCWIMPREVFFTEDYDVTVKLTFDTFNILLDICLISCPTSIFDHKKNQINSDSCRHFVPRLQTFPQAFQRNCVGREVQRTLTFDLWLLISSSWSPSKFFSISKRSWDTVFTGTGQTDNPKTWRLGPGDGK